MILFLGSDLVLSDFRERCIGDAHTSAMHLKALQTLLPPRPRRGNSYFVKFMARQERGVVKRAACCRAAVKITKITQGEEREGIYRRSSSQALKASHLFIIIKL